MTVSVRELLAQHPLGITLLSSGFDEAELSWSHSSDLHDPTPFLESGQLLLTTGRQFAAFERDDYVAYVERLARAGVVALGFGTEVLRDGTPAELVEACNAAGIALLEVPYATPFIAVSKFIADRLAAQARQQLEWALAAQDAMSKAVLGSGGLAAAVASASDALGCRIAVLDPDGSVLEGSAPDWLRERARDLLRRGSRARDQGGSRDQRGSRDIRDASDASDARDPDDASDPRGTPAAAHDSVWIAQTLGRSGRLLGAVVALCDNPLSPAETSVITMLTALTELALEHTEDQRIGFRSIAQQLLQLLRDGRVEAVHQALRHHPMQLPDEPFRVIAVTTAELAPTLRDALERMAAARERRLFAVEYTTQFVLLTDDSSRASVEAILTTEGLRAGRSAEAAWIGLADALSQASVALASATPGRVLDFDELTEGSVFGLLTEARVAEVARMRLSPLLGSTAGRARLHEAAVWLRCNGAWEPAARSLGLHRHTLKERIAWLGEQLDLPLESFHGRAELWALLAAADLAHD